VRTLGAKIVNERSQNESDGFRAKVSHALRKEGDEFLYSTVTREGQRNLKKHLAGKKFDDDDDVQEEVMALFKEQTADFYDSGIQKLVERHNKCFDNAGEYVEK